MSYYVTDTASFFNVTSTRMVQTFCLRLTSIFLLVSLKDTPRIFCTLAFFLLLRRFLVKWLGMELFFRMYTGVSSHPVFIKLNVFFDRTLFLQFILRTNFPDTLMAILVDVICVFLFFWLDFCIQVSCDYYEILVLLHKLIPIGE